MDPDQQLRNLRDFLLVYNRMTEICFQRCTSNFNYRNLTMNEERCVDNCAGKLIRSNHRLMSTYVQLMPRMVQRRMEEMESKAAENAKAAEAAATGALESAVAPAEASTTSETPAISSALPQVAQLAPNFGMETQGSVLKSASIDIPVEMDSPTSKPATATEITLSAAASLTPATDLVFNSTGIGPSDTSGSSHSPSAGAQKEQASPAPEFIPSKPTSITAVIPTPDAAATILSKNKESSLEQAVVPKVPPVSDQ